MLNFDEVPKSILQADDWHIVHASRVYDSDTIFVLEAQALLISVKHILRSSAAFGKRLLFLVDNLALALAINKGRSKLPAVNRIFRHILY